MTRKNGHFSSQSQVKPYACEACDVAYYFILSTDQRGANTVNQPEIAPALWQEWCAFGECGLCVPLILIVTTDLVQGLFRFPNATELIKIVRAWQRLTASRYKISWTPQLFHKRIRVDEEDNKYFEHLRKNLPEKTLVYVADQWQNDK